MTKVDYEIDKLYIDCGLSNIEISESKLFIDKRQLPNNQLNTGSLTREPVIYLSSTRENNKIS